MAPSAAVVVVSAAAMAPEVTDIGPSLPAAHALDPSPAHSEEQPSAGACSASEAQVLANEVSPGDQAGDGTLLADAASVEPSDPGRGAKRQRVENVN